MAKIFAPNKKYNGISAGVKFVNGVGETNDPRLIKWFKSKGYKVEDVKPKSKPKTVAKSATKAKTKDTSQKRKSNKQAQ